MKSTASVAEPVHIYEDAAAAWTVVAERDARFDGQFVYAVATTGIYCRPSCPSRRPRRANVTFFPTAEAAERAHYRQCQRCRPRSQELSRAQEIVKQACAYIESNLDRAVTLGELSRHVGFSPFHLQRTFKKLTGVSPKQYADARRVELFKSELTKGTAVTDAVYEAGYGSGSRVYEKSDAQLGMTPATYKRGGAGVLIAFTVVDSPLGRLLVAATQRGVCAVKLGADDGELQASLWREYPNATFDSDNGELDQWVTPIVQHLNGLREDLALPTDVRATAFQRQVWSALQGIPYGETRSYSEVAAAIGKPKSVRAVARACASNPVALVVPCHRVIRSDGDLGGYRWGLERKGNLLQQERRRAPGRNVG